MRWLKEFDEFWSKIPLCSSNLLPKVCRSWLLGAPSPKSLSKLVIGYTFSQSLSKLVIGHTCSTHAHLLPKVVEAGYWGTLHPSHYLHAQLHINPIPHTPTPTIHQPYTIPQPRPYPSSCELTATK